MASPSAMAACLRADAAIRLGGASAGAVQSVEKWAEYIIMEANADRELENYSRDEFVAALMLAAAAALEE